jgi:hypothetical protein
LCSTSSQRRPSPRRRVPRVEHRRLDAQPGRQDGRGGQPAQELVEPAGVVGGAGGLVGRTRQVAAALGGQEGLQVALAEAVPRRPPGRRGRPGPTG